MNYDEILRWNNDTLEQSHMRCNSHICVLCNNDALEQSQICTVQQSRRWFSHKCVPCNSHDAGTVTKRAGTVTITHGVSDRLGHPKSQYILYIRGFCAAGEIFFKKMIKINKK